MEFALSPPDVVRSINQSWLLKRWMRLRASSQLPPWDGLAADELAGISDNLAYADVLNRDDTVRFLIRFAGIRIAEYVGARCDGQGRFLDEALPPAYRDAALSTFHEALAAREPVYTVADMRDRGGRIVHFERLLLPFGRDGTSVDRILVSIEAVSPEGVFDGLNLIMAPAAPPAFAFCAIIDTRAVGAEARR
ncbi:MAG TPA: PAS domain-containing protein [Xanthobacteraceae bacterium]|nr:PAS domain-containing protein [Xanthobacteraceae bacterium]